LSRLVDREKLLEMLEDLKKEELEKFKWFLRDRDVLVELQPISESKLEKASTCDLVDLVVQTYTEKSGEVTKKVFRKINRNDLVQKLSDNSFLPLFSGSLVHLNSSLSGAFSSTKADQQNHFVDKHRVELIQRVSNIEQILDELQYKEVIDQEQYDKFRALPTSQGRMRELYSGPLKATCKDIFYESLLANEKFLVEDLSKK
uniref:Pyrin domain-containing protein n=1 Tax=Maylandia zebra TaxID=106582 RepID=A0A3P9DKX9_9CICH